MLITIDDARNRPGVILINIKINTDIDIIDMITFNSIHETISIYFFNLLSIPGAPVAQPVLELSRLSAIYRVTYIGLPVSVYCVTLSSHCPQEIGRHMIIYHNMIMFSVLTKQLNNYTNYLFRALITQINNLKY